MAFLDENGLARFKGKIQDEIDQKKDLQSSVASPSADGHTSAFIDTVSQNAQGVISATKKNVYGSDINISDSNNQKVGSAVEAIQNWKPSGNGTSGQVLRSKGDGTTEWAAAASQSEINTAVNAYMGSHMSPNQTIALDNSLTSTTSAAQAAAAGNQVLVSDSQPSASTNKLWIKQTPESEVSIPTMDEFDDLKSALHGQHDYVPYAGTNAFTYGRSLNSNGQPNWNVRACATLVAFDVSNVEKVIWTGTDNTQKEYKSNIYFFSDEAGNNYISDSSLASAHTGKTVTVPANAKSARINFRYDSSTGVDEITEALFAPYYGVYFESKFKAVKIDDTLTKNGQPADAKAVKDAIDVVKANLQESISSVENELHHQHGFVPYLGTEMFTYGRSIDDGELNYNDRACATLEPFDVSKIEYIRWTGADNAEKAYNVFVHFYSDEAGETYISNASLADNHYKRIVMIPSNAKSARISFMYYSGTGIDEITEALFVPYFGVYFCSEYDDKENGANFSVFIPHSGSQSATFSTVLASANEKFILMDFGTESSAPAAITKIKRRTNRIHVAIISHYHDDHVGGLDKFFASSSGIDFTGCVFFLPPVVNFTNLGETAPERDYATRVETIKSKIEAAGATYQVISENSAKISILGFDLHFYNIDSEKYAVYYETLNASGNAIYNNFSMINTVSYRGKTFLYTADMVAKAQELNTGAISENIDILYAPHHGWNDCYVDFFYRLSPKYCVAQNYIPQIPEYVEYLNSRYIPYLNTADCDTVEIVMGANGIYMYNEDGINTNSNNIRYIIANDDLNKLKEPGMYICSSDDIAATLLNCPVSIGFTLDVEYGNAYTRRRQTLRDVSSETCRIYTRTRGSSSESWTNWFVLEGTPLA